MIIAPLALALAVLAQTPTPPASAPAAPAAAAAQAAAPTPAAAAPDPSERICRSIRVTGSRFPVRECRTRAEYDEIERAAQESLQTMQRNRGGPSGSPR